MIRAFIELTDAQRVALRHLFAAISNHGGAIMGQIFSDGIHVVALTDEVADRVATATGLDQKLKTSSGFKEFSDGIERDRKGGAA